MENTIVKPELEISSVKINYANSEIEAKRANLLDRLLDLGIKQCDEGKKYTHDQVMAKIKLKYNLKF